MEFMNDLAKECFNYIISDETFLPNVKKVFGIESAVVSDLGDDKEVYSFVGYGCGITYIKYDRRCKGASKLDEIEYNVVNNLHEYFVRSFTNKEKA